MSCSLKMRFAFHTSILFAALSASIGTAFAQQPGIPLWQYNIVGPSNNINTIGQQQTYTGSMVGTDPFNAPVATTTIPVVLIPVRLTYPAQPAQNPWSYPTPEIVFDPTAISCVANRTPVDIAQSSPLFNNMDYVVNGVDVGNTQYVDAFQRSNFWQAIQGTEYHLLFQLQTLPVMDVTVPPDQGSAFWAGCFINNAINGGSMRMAWFDNYIQTNLLPSLTAQGIVGPNTLPIFYLDTVTMILDNPIYADSVSYSYHSAIQTNSGTQFYAVVTFNASGTTPPSSGVPAPDQPLSDELINWVNNPYGTNQTPAWGWIGYTLGCYAAYAPPWPLTNASNYALPFNDYTYTTTEQSFFSWFYDQSPSIAAGSLYSDHGALTNPASAQGCTFADSVSSGMQVNRFSKATPNSLR